MQDFCRIVAHLLRHLHRGDDLGIHKFGDGKSHARLQSDDAERSFLEGLLFLGQRMRCMIGADDIEDIVFQTLAQCLEILFRTERRIHLVVGVALYDVVAAEGKVMRADLGGNRNAGLSRLTHHIHALFGRAVTQMQVCTCLCGKYDISCNNRVLYGVCDARQMPLSRVCILIHAAAVYEVLVLAVSQHRNVFLCGNLHGLFVEQRVHNGFSVLADRRDAGFYHALDIGELFTLLSYCDGACLQYGAGAQKKMADFSEKTLENVRSKDLGEIGDLLTSVVTELKTFDAEEEKGPFSFFKKSTNKINAMKAKYDKAEVNVNKICDVLDGHQRQLLKDIAILDQMYAQNLNYFKELTMYILAGKKKLELVRSTELRDLQNKAQMTGKAEDAQAAKDLEDLCNRFEKKLYDLELTRMVSIQTAPQIRMIQNSDSVMAEKIQSTLVNTIPLWKNQMIIALGVHHSTEAAKAQRQVSDMTNELLKKNAENLKMATIETAKESERGIVDMETLKQTNQSLISTLDEVMKIQEDGRQKRAAAEVELVQLENDIKKKMLELSAGGQH